MAKALSDVNSIPPFDAAETANVSARWKRWVRAFELYADGKGVTDAAQKKALFLHTAGMNVQDIFFTLEIVGEADDDDYVKTKKTLEAYFKPQSNVPYERHVFRNMAQIPTETIEQYITRLRIQAETCDFGNRAAVDEQIRDQVIDKCISQPLRRKLLEQGRELKLDKLRDIARAKEESDKQAKQMEGLKTEVNRLTFKDQKGKQPFKSPSSQQKVNDALCFACGYQGHLAKDPKCPAKGKKCRKCHGLNHFEKQCKTKPFQQKHGGQPVRKSHVRVRQVEECVPESHDPPDYAFSIYDGHNADIGRVEANVGGIDMSLIIDSGASCNVIDRQTWEELKSKGIMCSSSASVSKMLYAYGSEQPLKTAGTFQTNVKVGNKEANTEFTVIEGSGQSLLGRDTALKLSVLSLGKVNSLQTSEILDKFPELKCGVGKLKDFQLKIPVDDSIQPVAQSTRRIPYQLREKLDRKLDELEQLEIIEKVEGPSLWVSPVVCVPKGQDDIRLCVDMRRANEAVMRERHPIPTIEDIMQDFNKSKIFSKLDIKWAYHQIELSPSSRKITVFSTHRGLYQYTRLFFGISCAPEMYQKVIQQLLQNCEGANNILDDIIVHGKTQQEHDERLLKVLQVLRDNKLTVNVEKCEFNMSELIFMGHVLSARGIGPARLKVEAVKNAREPQSASEVKSFLGLVTYSARFIPNLATVSAPLRDLIKKNTPFCWGPAQQKSFEKLKDLLARAETLAYFDINAPTQVIADASPVGLGAVLVQEHGEESRVICYASRSLSDVEKRYSQTEKEALALVWACERFHMYLYGTEFELLTDHRPLECIYSPRSKPCARIERWLLRMQPYKYKVTYIKGCKNIADSLSRLLSKSKEESETRDSAQDQEYIKFVAEQATPIAMTTREIERAAENDPELCDIRDRLRDNQWQKLTFKEYLVVRNELSSLGQLILRGTRIVVPKSLRGRVLDLAHEGHPGIVCMKSRLRSKVWWPGMDKQVEKYCKECYGCQLVSKPSNPEPMRRSELPSAAWQHLAADLLGPLPSGDYLFVVVDYYSRYFEVEITKSTTAEKITALLSKIFTTHGLPLSIQTDNGPQFISELFKTYVNENGIVHHKTTPLWPQANGEVERQNRSILKRLRIAQAEKRDWKTELQSFLIMYRTTPHTVTGISPSELLFKRKLRTKLPTLSDFPVDDIELRDRDSERKEKGKLYADEMRNARESDVEVGDAVLMRQEKENKLSTPFCPSPYKVVSKTGNQVVIESDEGVQYDRNVTHVKRFNQPSTTERNVVEVAKENAENLDPGLAEPKPAAVEVENTSEQSTVHSSPVHSSPRPAREKKLPVKFRDYVLSK